MVTTSTLSTRTPNTGMLGAETSEMARSDNPAPTRVWLYRQSERSCWSVGYLDLAGQWRSESDHLRTEDAASRVHWLNGGNHDAACVEALDSAEDEVDRLEATVDRLSAEATRWQRQMRARDRRVSKLRRRMGRR